MTPVMKKGTAGMPAGKDRPPTERMSENAMTKATGSTKAQK